MKKTVSVVGLGKLGLPLAISIASRGFEVIGVDVNKKIVDSINAKKSPFYEPDLEDFLTKHGKRLKATTDMGLAIEKSEITFIIVPTPSLQNGRFSTKYVREACKEIGKHLKTKKIFHLVVVVSTVMPESCEKEIIPVLEKNSGKKCGKDFGFCYNPEFIALGSVIRNLLYPEQVLIGEADKKSGNLLERFYQKFCVNKPAVNRMNIVNAEIAKISLNCYITTKISFANFLTEVCENVPGGSVDEVLNALGNDSRIGRKYLGGGLGYGGPCFPRDNKALRKFCSEINTEAHIPIAVDKINSKQVIRLFARITENISKNDSIGIFGLSYKPNTAVIDESQGIMLAKMLMDKNYRVSVFDPKSMENSKTVLGKKVEYSTSLKKCLDGKSLIVIATPWELFKTELKDMLKSCKREVTLIDCWRIFPKDTFSPNINHIRLGESAK